jgi:hypothetical protein
MDVTEFYRPGWQAPEVIDFDEVRCAELDQLIASTTEFKPIRIETLPGFDIGSIDPQKLFALHEEPDFSRQIYDADSLLQGGGK